MSKIAVVGAGGVGSYFAARAALAGNDVTLCVRRERPEFTVRSGGEELRPDVRTVTAPDEMGDVDWVLLGVKAHQTAGAAPWLRALDHGAALVMLQNGVRLPDRVTGLWSGPVLPAVVLCAVEVVSPGVVEHHSLGWFSVASSPLGTQLAGVFGPEQQQVRLVPDIVRAGWEKLVSNAAANSITALTLRRMDVFGDESIRRLGEIVMRECVAVGRADGVEIDGAIVDETMQRLQGMPVDGGSSMLYDRLGGVELEYEALVGAVVAIGAEHGVPTPVSSVLLTLLQAVSGRALPTQ